MDDDPSAPTEDQLAANQQEELSDRNYHHNNVEFIDASVGNMSENRYCTVVEVRATDNIAKNKELFI